MSLRGVEQATQAPELRHKLLWTFGLLAAYRIGVHVPVPGIDVPASAWLLGVGVTGLIMVAATFLPTLSALRLPEPRVVARLAAE